MTNFIELLLKTNIGITHKKINEAMEVIVKIHRVNKNE